MQKWDYKVIHFGLNEVGAGLKQLGTEGWELVAAHFGPVSVGACILKRPIK